MTTEGDESAAADGAQAGATTADGEQAASTTVDGRRYEVTLDRDACDGIFACLVRDDRFVEAADGLATIESASSEDAATVTASFADDRIDDARQAAAACPVDAIAVEEVGDG